MELAALIHRPESEDAFLYDPQQLRLRFHTKKDDVAKVAVIYSDPYWYVPDKAGQVHLNSHQKQMTLTGQGQAQDYWMASVKAPFQRLIYLFVVTGKDGSKVLVGDRGIRSDTAANRRDGNNYFHLPYFHEIDRVKTPDWVKRTVWYQIFPERFANGDKTNDPQGTKPWNPQDHPSREDFYGGDLQGVLDHLDDLQKLGVNGLYFCPIFTASSNHKYDTIDYLNIDPAFGDKALFAQLVNAAHARGMKVMLDAVFNHMGYQSMQWQDVLKNGEKSRFASWFHIHDYPLTPFHDPRQDGKAPQYDTFAFEPHMPKLNTANPEVQDYLLEVATYWIKEFDIDAWRLDVANEVDHHFWKKFHQAAVAIKPDFYILGEVWHSSQSWLNGDEFSGVMNYAFTQQIEDHFLAGKQDAKTMVALLTDQLMLYRDQNDQVMLNMLDSHDTKRLLTAAGEDKDKAMQALAFTFSQTGAPCIYYGTEMGMTGKDDPDDRKPMDWQQQGGAMWQRVHALIAFRLAHADTFGQGQTQMQVLANGLIQVTRRGRQTITAWFNTTDQSIALKAKAQLAQGFEGGLLAAKGFVFSVGA